jgi:IS5 family transposase
MLRPAWLLALLYQSDLESPPANESFYTQACSKSSHPLLESGITTRHHRIDTETGLAPVGTSPLQAARTPAALALGATLEHYLPLVQQVIDQTTRRVVHGEKVPATEKIVSLFEPHTAIIQRGKAQPHETEFGRKVWYGEADGGIITDYRLLSGNPPEAPCWLPSLKHQRQVLGRPPEIATADRALYSPANEKGAKALGVKRVVLPKPGVKTPARQRQEAQPWFKAVHRWRSGIEGRISHLRRARGLDHCFNHGEAGMERWLGWGVIANNLMVIATTLTRPRRRSAKRKA